MGSLQQRLARLERLQDLTAAPVPQAAGRVVLYQLGATPARPDDLPDGAPLLLIPHNGREPRPAAPA